MQVNPQTGFIEAQNINKNNFDSAKKLAILDFVSECASKGKWPKVNQILKLVGISQTTFYEHLEADHVFKAAYEDAIAPLEDHIVSNMVEQSSNANGITAGIFLLKNRWKQRWNENFQVNFNGDNEALKRLHSSAIEAEIVDKKELKPG